MRKTLKIFSILFFLVACSGKNKIPHEILSPQKMQAIIWDMLRADGYVSDYLAPKDSTLNKTESSIKLYEEIFQIHKTNKAEFKKSFLYYQSHPIAYKLLLDSLNVRHVSSVDKEDKPALTDSTLKKKIAL